MSLIPFQLAFRVSQPCIWSVKYPGIMPPPIPASVQLSDAHFLPKWYPTKVTLWNISQQHRRVTSHSGGSSEADFIYRQLEVLAGGLKSGEKRPRAPLADQRVDVVYWQKQECHCHQSSLTFGAICTNRANCKSLLIVFNGSWNFHFRVCFHSI